MAENRNAQQVREITDKLEQGIKELWQVLLCICRVQTSARKLCAL